MAGLGRQSPLPARGQLLVRMSPGGPRESRRTRDGLGAARRRGRAQLCALPRCQSPLLLALQGPGPRDCEGAQEQEDGADGSRAPGGWPSGGRRAPRARPFLPRPATRASTRAPSAFSGCRASASPGVTAVAGGAGARGARPLHVHWRDHKALELHPVRFYQTVCSSVNARN